MRYPPIFTIVAAASAAGCARTVDLSGSPRPFVPRDTLVARSDYGDAVIRSSVGSVALTIDGHRVDAAQAPGAGERIALRGQGRDRFRIETGVGRAQLTIEPRRNPGD